jgi:hypothetical protein
MLKTSRKVSNNEQQIMEWNVYSPASDQNRQIHDRKTAIQKNHFDFIIPIN